MRSNKVFQLRLSAELLRELRRRKPNVSSYIRTLIRDDLAKNDASQVPPVPEIRAKSPYTFYAKLDKVVDGDSLFLIADLGFYVSFHCKIRLSGIDSPPLAEPGGLEAKNFVERELRRANLIVESHTIDKYGRYLAYIYYHRNFTNFIDIVRDGKSINAELIKHGLAKMM